MGQTHASRVTLQSSYLHPDSGQVTRLQGRADSTQLVEQIKPRDLHITLLRSVEDDGLE
jgi:hypothetical protein